MKRKRFLVASVMIFALSLGTLNAQNQSLFMEGAADGTQSFGHNPLLDNGGVPPLYPLLHAHGLFTRPLESRLGQTQREPNLLDPGMTTHLVPATTIISTRTYHTLHNNSSFAVNDRDLVRLDKNDWSAHPVFYGLPFKTHTLNAADVIAIEPLPKTGAIAPRYGLLFSLRENSYLENPWGGDLYARKQDVVLYDSFSHYFYQVFDGVYFNCPGVDAVFELEVLGSTFQNPIVISPSSDWLCQVGVPATYFFQDQDLVLYDPNTNTIAPFLYGSDFGIRSLDGADLWFGKIYFSVRDAQYIQQPGASIYLRDQDVAYFALNPGLIDYFIQGEHFYLHDVDAVSVGIDPGEQLLYQGIQPAPEGEISFFSEK